jgi:5-methylcytosine-specific restriction endonuclease McrA
MTRRPDHIPPRKAFPKSVKAAVLKRSGGSCEAYGCTNTGRDFDHIKAVAVGGESTLENCRLLCRSCNAAKGIEEAEAAAKADRQGGRSGQTKRRKDRKAKGTHRPIPSQPLKSRGFDKTRNRRMNGKIEER